jgi:HK97 family phage major capsid protein
MSKSLSARWAPFIIFGLVALAAVIGYLAGLPLDGALVLANAPLAVTPSALEAVHRAVQELSEKASQSAQANREKLDELSTDFTKLQAKWLQLAQERAEGIKGPGAAPQSFAVVTAKKIAEHDQIKAWATGNANRLVNRVAIDVDLAMAMQTKAPLVQTGDNLAPYDRMVGITPLSSRLRWLWQYLPLVTSAGSGIEYLRESGSFRTAGLQSSEGDEKPESSFTMELTARKFETIAHWTQVSRQALADNAQLGPFLDERLMQGVWAKLEQQIINGNGTTPQLSGLLDAGNYTAYSGNSSSDGIGKLDHMRDAIRALQVANYAAGLFIVHPDDWFEIETERTSGSGEYVWAQPASMLPPVAWGLPVHVSTDMPAGNFVCMDPNAATVHFRQSAQVLVGTHGNGMIENLTTMLCEGRFALAVHRPEAVLYGSFDAA